MHGQHLRQVAARVGRGPRVVGQGQRTTFAMASRQGTSVSSASRHMEPAMQALCYYYQHPPPKSGAKPQLFRAIPALIQRPRMKISRVKMAVARFM